MTSYIAKPVFYSGMLVLERYFSRKLDYEIFHCECLSLSEIFPQRRNHKS